MYFIINLSGSQQFSGSSIQNQVELSEWATGRFMRCWYSSIACPKCARKLCGCLQTQGKQSRKIGTCGRDIQISTQRGYGTITQGMIRSRPNQITGPGPKSGPARKSESRGPENGVSRWRRPNSEIYSQNHHFGLVYDMIYQFLGMETKNYKFGMFCQQCHPSVASGDADIRPRNASRIPTCHLFTS